MEEQSNQKTKEKKQKVGRFEYWVDSKIGPTSLFFKKSLSSCDLSGRFYCASSSSNSTSLLSFNQVLYEKQESLKPRGIVFIIKVCP